MEEHKNTYKIINGIIHPIYVDIIHQDQMANMYKTQFHLGKWKDISPYDYDFWYRRCYLKEHKFLTEQPNKYYDKIYIDDDWEGVCDDYDDLELDMPYLTLPKDMKIY